MLRLKALLFSLLRITAVSAAITLLCGSAAYAQTASSDRPVDRDAARNYFSAITGRAKSGELDLSQKFSVEYRFVLDKDGKMDTAASKPLKSSGDTKLTTAAVDGILAMEKSGYFIYLKALRARKGKIFVGQNGKDFSVVVRTDYDSEEETVGAMAAVAAFIGVGRADSADSDEKFVFQNLKVSTDITTLTLRFAVPASQLKQLLA